MAEFEFNLGNKVVIQRRQTYGFLEFLGDSGGVYESCILLGTFLHMVFSKESLAVRLLETHFRAVPRQLSSKDPWNFIKG